MIHMRADCTVWHAE